MVAMTQEPARLNLRVAQRRLASAWRQRRRDRQTTRPFRTNGGDHHVIKIIWPPHRGLCDRRFALWRKPESRPQGCPFARPLCRRPGCSIMWDSLRASSHTTSRPLTGKLEPVAQDRRLQEMRLAALANGPQKVVRKATGEAGICGRSLLR